MPTFLLDTHAWAWSLTDNPQLSVTARRIMTQGDPISVSPVSIFEIGQKVRLGKWPEMAGKIGTLLESMEGQGAAPAPLTPDVALRAGLLDWPHRDPFDRLIAATVLVNGWVLISADTAFDTLTGLRRLW
jgi:PIN domain nuclease of toxin-antitoxin system